MIGRLRYLAFILSTVLALAIAIVFTSLGYVAVRLWEAIQSLRRSPAQRSGRGRT